jgi:class 3 adenylate cyclase
MMQPETIDHRRPCPGCGAAWPSPLKFCGNCGTPLIEAQRRHDGQLSLLSIVFCDVVGSTEWSTRLDPEDLRDAIRRYQGRCNDAVNELGGRIIRFIGDGVLATFGGPEALEDSARRAVDAALEMVEATSRILTPLGEYLAARAAVHTGYVVLGQMGEGPAATELDLVGEAANAASRLQGLAPVGGVLISESVADAVEGRFVLRPVGVVSLRGIEAPIRAFEVTGRTAAVDRLSARAVSGLTPFIGREAERALVLRRCAEAAEEAPQIVVVVGEAGIGKSRLVREVRESPELEDARLITLRGEPDRASTPFGPFLTLAEEAAPGDGVLPAAVREMLGPPDKIESADHRRARTIDALCSWLAGIARRQFVLVVVEDLHWVDPSTLEVLETIHSSATETRLAVVATSRTPWRSPWPEIDGLTVLPLDRLNNDAIEAMFQALGVNDVMPVQQLVARAEGVPLYLEEIAALAQRGRVLEHGQIPVTIAELLGSRLEATGDSEVASDCSVLGIEVDCDIAARVLDVEPADLRRRLDHLVRAGIMRSRAGGRQYAFRHGLLRDAAYGMLLRSDRIRLHERTAEALTQHHADRRAEEIARHWEAAGRPESAWRSWVHAAELAVQRGAFVEAASFYDAALRSFEALPESSALRVDELAVAIEATTLAFRIHGGAAPETMSLNARCDRLADAAIADRGLDQFTHLMLLAGMLALYVSRPEYERARDRFAELDALREQGGTVAILAAWLQGSFALMVGDDDRAELDFTDCLRMYDARRSQLGQPDVGVVAAASLAHVATARGFYDDADRWVDVAFEYLSVNDGPFHRAWLALDAAKVFARRNDRARTRVLAVEARELAITHGFAEVASQSRALVAWTGPAEGAGTDFEALRESLHELDRSGSRGGSSVLILLLARGLHEAARTE